MGSKTLSGAGSEAHDEAVPDEIVVWEVVSIERSASTTLSVEKRRVKRRRSPLEVVSDLLDFVGVVGWSGLGDR